VRRLLPDTLAGWVIVVLIGGLALSQCVTLAVNYRTRTGTATVLEHFRIAERVADVVRLVGGSPPEQRQRMLSSLAGPTLRAGWSARPSIPDAPPGDWHAQLFGEVVQSALWDVSWRELRVALVEAPPAAVRTAAAVPDRRRAATPGVARSVNEIIAEHERASVLRVSLQLDDQTWLNFEAPLVDERNVASPWSVPLLALAALAILAASIWAVRRLTAPLTTLADAAEQLGRDVNAAPLSETGPQELRQAAHAFNLMQERIQRFVRDRTLMVAAMSHDLRTPITRLRLRAEFVEDEEQRRRMLADLADMESMVDSTLAFVREEASTEATSSADLVSLVASVCEDRADVSFVVDPQVGSRLPYPCRPVALVRCLANVVDNAVKYAGSAEVHLAATESSVVVIVDDRGPGIAAVDHERAFAPFTRLDASRNRDTGGTGLGLTIARAIARAHGGEVSLEDRPGGGLRVRVVLPR
jgi:signal transduction histidine kinase